MKKLKKVLFIFIILIIAGILSLFSIDLYVKVSTEKKMFTVEELKCESKDYDCIVVLGAGLKNDGTPSPMLKERIDKGIELYNEGISPKIIMSGDHEFPDHDEVNAMKTYAFEQGVPAEDIFMDHAGISTYDSMYRAKEIFGAEKVIVVTQKYHLYRATYIGNNLGLETVGVDAEKTKYSGTAYRETREFLARIKDFFKCAAKPKSLYGGKETPVFGDGNVTNDKEYIIIERYLNEKDKKKIYINNRTEIQKIKNIVENGEYKKETSDHIPDYVMTLNKEEYYLIIAKDSIIRKDDTEAILNKEDAEFLKAILES